MQIWRPNVAQLDGPERELARRSSGPPRCIELRYRRPSTVPTDPPAPSAPSAAWIFLPALGAPLAHAPVLCWDLLPGLRRPISRRLFGENKTWRGALVMTAGTVAATVILHRLPGYQRRLPQPVADTNPAVLGTVIGSACWLGELPNSFLKRRLGYAVGARTAPL